MSTIVKLACLSSLQVLGLSLAASIFWSCLPMVIYVVRTYLLDYHTLAKRLCYAAFAATPCSILSIARTV